MILNISESIIKKSATLTEIVIGSIELLMRKKNKEYYVQNSK